MQDSPGIPGWSAARQDMLIVELQECRMYSDTSSQSDESVGSKRKNRPLDRYQIIRFSSGPILLPIFSHRPWRSDEQFGRIVKNGPLFFDFGIEKKMTFFNCLGDVFFKKNRKKTVKKPRIWTHFFVDFDPENASFFSKKKCVFCEKREFLRGRHRHANGPKSVCR